MCNTLKLMQFFTIKLCKVGKSYRGKNLNVGSNLMCSFHDENYIGKWMIRKYHKNSLKIQ